MTLIPRFLRRRTARPAPPAPRTIFEVMTERLAHSRQINDAVELDAARLAQFAAHDAEGV